MVDLNQVAARAFSDWVSASRTIMVDMVDTAIPGSAEVTVVATADLVDSVVSRITNITKIDAFYCYLSLFLGVFFA